jgi:hypothetical protein
MPDLTTNQNVKKCKQMPINMPNDNRSQIAMTYTKEATNIKRQ